MDSKILNIDRFCGSCYGILFSNKNEYNRKISTNNEDRRRSANDTC